jgi:hypothetical protein
MKRLLALILAAALGHTVSAVTILTVEPPDAHYLGSIVPDNPAGETAEAFYINIMRDLAEGGSVTIEKPPPYIQESGDDIVITRSVNVFANLPEATALPSFRDETSPPTSIDLGYGYAYLVAKYGNNAYVWYVGDVTLVEGDDVTIPSFYPSTGGGLSHVSLYNPVPDGGMTVVLLGLALTGLGVFRFRSVRK